MLMELFRVVRMISRNKQVMSRFENRLRASRGEVR